MNRDQLEPLREWLLANGAVILPHYSENVALRVRTTRMASRQVYFGKNGTLKVESALVPVMEAFRRGEAMDLRPSYEKGSEGGNKMRRRLASRDGMACWYCGLEFAGFDDDRMTIEELFARSKGGIRTDHNCVLACQPCNVEVGDLPVATKVKIRDKKRYGAAP